MTNSVNKPASYPEDEEKDPVGKPYPEQGTDNTPEDGDDPPHPPFSPDNEPDIPQDPESKRVVQPDPPNE